MEKLKLIKNDFEAGNRVIRATDDTYTKLSDLSKLTGISMPQILKKIVDFAVDKIEILEE
jgi:hypothetical protein